MDGRRNPQRLYEVLEFLNNLPVASAYDDETRYVRVEAEFLPRFQEKTQAFIALDPALEKENASRSGPLKMLVRPFRYGQAIASKQESVRYDVNPRRGNGIFSNQ